MTRKIALVIIDPQNSFCNVVDPARQQVLHDGELCVPGALDDMSRLANLVDRLGKKLDDIHVTLDSHRQLHIAHPIWYRDADGKQPDAFTVMREVKGAIIGSRLDSGGIPHDIGEFSCFSPSVYKRTLAYLKALEASGRYPHIIWPPHCLIGTPGHNIVPQLAEALFNWERDNNAAIDILSKGSNFFVEHFSAVRAEVVDPADPTTPLNTYFIDRLMNAEEVVFAGEAGSHSLAATVQDIADYCNDGAFLKNCVLLTDGTSPLPGFETYQDRFFEDMAASGMKMTTTIDYLT